MRKITIYMIKKHTGTTNKNSGENFGGISYSAVAKTYQRFLNQLRRKISEIENEMSYVNGLTPYPSTPRRCLLVTEQSLQTKLSPALLLYSKLR